jgi:hypothetical protein
MGHRIGGERHCQCVQDAARRRERRCESTKRLSFARSFSRGGQRFRGSPATPNRASAFAVSVVQTTESTRPSTGRWTPFRTTAHRTTLRAAMAARPTTEPRTVASRPMRVRPATMPAGCSSTRAVRSRTTPRPAVRAAAPPASNARILKGPASASRGAALPNPPTRKSPIGNAAARPVRVALAKRRTRETTARPTGWSALMGLAAGRKPNAKAVAGTSSSSARRERRAGDGRARRRLGVTSLRPPPRGLGRPIRPTLVVRRVACHRRAA